jgi:pimeloyl-ACP methyl ester carboxylesterase
MKPDGMDVLFYWYLMASERNDMMRKLLTRRTAVGAMAGALALPASRGSAQSIGQRKTFVLVHGAWHGGWCWRRVTDLLELQGHKVFTPTLTGLGERSHLINPTVNASTHVDDVVNVINWENLDDVVLVGHSYGGLAITGVADRIADKISRIVYLDAFMLEDGESVVEKASANTKSIIDKAIEGRQLSLKSPPSSVFGVGEQDRPWVESKLTPQPTASFSEKVANKGGREKIAKKFYMRAKRYPSPTFDGYLERAKANPGWSTFEFDSGHDVMVVQPQQLAEQLLKV